MKNCVVLLPGRNSKSSYFKNLYIKNSELIDTEFIGIDPEIEWYPFPNDIKKTTEAIKSTCDKLNKKINNIKKDFNNLALVGFSAGATIAIQYAINNALFNAIIIHSGAIFDINNIPKNKTSAPFMLIHNKKDNVFSWEERYIPMRTALINNGYNIQTIENDDILNKHSVTVKDVIFAGKFIKTKFNNKHNIKISTIIY